MGRILSLSLSFLSGHKIDLELGFHAVQWALDVSIEMGFQLFSVGF